MDMHAWLKWFTGHVTVMKVFPYLLHYPCVMYQTNPPHLASVKAAKSLL